MLLLPIVLPFLAGAAALLLGRRAGALGGPLAVVATAINLVVAIVLFRQGGEVTFVAPWATLGMEFSLRAYQFSNFIVLAAAGFGLLVSLYCVKFMCDRKHANQFYCYMLISLALVNGAVLANNLIAMLFFWEGLLGALFGIIAIGRPGAWKTATKAFVIVGISDLCMMLGIALTYHLAGTLTISKINLPLGGLGAVAMILMMIGAISKAGSMPFHSWIPDAALDAPLPFMAILPASLEKLLGIYFLARISLDMFQLSAESWISPLMMIIGAVTILLAVMMALVQKDYKRLLSYHAISQVGYMILGIGTCLPIGIVGGLFHMINHAMYKSCLFLTGGSVEKQAGTTDLAKLGGLARKMPITFGCFIVAAASISGVPPFNGFFSKELVYDAALERGILFYVAALLGSFFTAASFLKLGHAAFLDKGRNENAGVTEAPRSMLIPMVVIAALCVVFGVWNGLPLHNFIQPALAGSHFGQLNAHEIGDYSGMHGSRVLLIMTALSLLGALANHLWGAKVSGSGLGAADHIHHAPSLSWAYDRAAQRQFDPYDLVLKLLAVVSNILWRLDRANDWIYDRFTVGLTMTLSRGVRLAHGGNYAMYVLWAILAAAAVLVFLVKS
ncbi:MAG: proton-conducting transporter membrane subunit [Phycisphaerae bacterium]